MAIISIQFENCQVTAEKERNYIVCPRNYSENALHNEPGIYDMNTWLQLSGVYNTLECQRHDNQQSILNSKWLLTKESCWAPSNSRKVNPLPFTILGKRFQWKIFKIKFRPSKPRHGSLCYDFMKFISCQFTTHKKLLKFAIFKQLLLWSCYKIKIILTPMC